MSRVSFGEFVLDLDARQLCEGARTIPLTPKAYQLLEVLLTNRPKALSKFTLLERLWPDTFVLDKNLVNLIAEIRHALGHDPATPRFVRTVHRFGYAFQPPPPEPPSRAMTGTRPAVSVRLQWASGRARLGDGEHVLGRDHDLELCFESPGVSRRHAVLRITGPTATLEDLGSKNGTFVGERLIDEPTQLRDGDRVRIGSVRLTFHVVRTPASTRTEPGRCPSAAVRE